VDKPTLILLPGLLCDERLWSQQAAALSDVAEVHCAALTHDDSVSDMAARVLQDAPERFAVAGLSMGALVAFEIIRQVPERVTHLGLLDTNHRAFTSQQIETYRMYIDLAKTGRFDEITDVHLLPVLTRNRHDLMPTIRAMAQSVGCEAFIRQATATMNRPDNTETLRRVTCPTLVLTGRQDVLCSVEWHRETMALVPNAALVIIEDCGHLSTLEQPQAVSAAMRGWLQKETSEWRNI